MGRRRVLARAGVGALGLVSGGLAGCGAMPAAPTAAPSAPASGSTAVSAPAPTATVVRLTPKYGGALKTLGIPDRNLDPHALNGATIGTGAGLCFSQLLAYKWGADVKPPSYLPGPDLAESWTQADDLTYVFKMRSGAKWHNLPPVGGREVVADDIVFSFQRIRDLKVNATLVAGIAKMETPDKLTLKVTLDKPNADFLGNISDYRAKIVAREAVALRGNLEEGPVIGTGPWIFERYSPTDGFAATRNPEYFLKGLPFADRMEAYYTTDAAFVSATFRSGNVNAIGSGVTVENANEILGALPNTRATWVTLDRTFSAFVPKLSVDPFSDQRVRQAINKAIDRKAILETIFLKRAVLSPGVALPTRDWSLPDAELEGLLARDVEGARRLMKEAGKESGFDLEITVPTYLVGVYVTIGELVQANLKEIGVRATLKPLDPVTYSQQLARGNFQAYLGASGASGTNDHLYGEYYSGGPRNYAGYSSPDLDKLIDQQAVLTKDPDARKTILQQVQRLIISQSIAVHLFHRQQPVLSAPEVMDLYPSAEAGSAGTMFTTAWINK
jgi:peptide/nickel transport system substrate-binding protein